MSFKVVDEIRVCSDCVPAIANDDYTSLDYYYFESRATEREEEIRDGINRLTEGGRHLAGVDEPAGFSWHACECCGDGMGGNRWTVAVLESEPPKYTFVISAGVIEETYTAESEAEALELYARDALYASYAELVEDHGPVDFIREE